MFDVKKSACRNVLSTFACKITNDYHCRQTLSNLCNKYDNMKPQICFFVRKTSCVCVLSNQ